MYSSFLPLHRLALTLFATLFGSLLLWSLIAEVDIVVSAQGKLVPANFVPVAQPSESGTIRRVLVNDGESVTQGQPLVEMDPLFAAEDSKAASSEVARLEQQLIRIQAELENKAPLLSDAIVTAEYESRRAAYRAAMAEAQSTLARAEADLTTIKARQSKANRLAPVAIRQEDMLNKLKSVGFVSEAMYNDKLRDRLDSEGESLIQAQSVRAGEAAVAQAQSALIKVSADYKKSLRLEESDLRQRLTQAQAEKAKREHRAEMTIVKAPVAGTVTSLVVHTPGQVLTAGAPLLSLVPAGESLRFEGWLRNEDSGLVFPEMASKVKLAAYPFQKYGWIAGELSWVGVDSETPDSMKNTAGEPLYYRVRVALGAQQLKANGAPISLRPGQQATADIQVGTRTVFEFLTSPMRKVLLEAGREK